MSSEISEKGKLATSAKSNGIAGFMALIYAVVSYVIGAGALFWLFFVSIGVAPMSVAGYQASSPIMAWLVDVLLVVLFGLQHSIMARPAFKDKWTRLVPQPIERATYVLASGLCFILLLSFWQPLGGTVWIIESEGIGLALRVLAGLGFAYLLLASFFTNHFELFGLRQAWLYARGIDYSPLHFKQNWMYGFSRHPIMLGMLVVLWSTAEMSMTRFALAVLLSVYVFVGVAYEERTLTAEFGDKYRQYKREVGMFFTLPGRK